MLPRIILYFIGWLYLALRYRDREVMRRIRNKEYGGDNSVAGLVVVLNTVAGLGALILTSILLVMIFKFIKQLVE